MLILGFGFSLVHAYHYNNAGALPVGYLYPNLLLSPNSEMGDYG